MVTTVLEQGEQLCEIFDVVALFAFPPRDANLDHISAPVQAKQAPDRDVIMNVCRNDLEGEIQSMRLLKHGPLFARHPGDPVQLC
jgi:hypothetical protein